MEYLRIISDIWNLSNLSQRLRKNSFDADRSLDIVQFIMKMNPTAILNWFPFDTIFNPSQYAKTGSE